MADRRAIGVLLALSVAGFAGAALAAPPALELYGKLPFIETVALSPDGRMLAYGVTDGEQRTVMIETLDTGKVIAGIKAGANKVRALQWAGPNHLIITASVTANITDVITARSEWFMATDYNLAKNRQLSLLSNVADPAHRNDTLNVLYSEPQIRFADGHAFAYVEGTVFVDNEGRLGLFKVDLDDNDRAQILFEGFAHTTGYALSAQGKPLAETEYDARDGRWVMKLLKDHWTEVERDTTAFEHPAIQGLGRDGASVAVVFRGAKESVLRELSPDGKTWSDPTPNPDALVWDGATSRMIARYDLNGDTGRYEFFDAHDAAVWKALIGAYPGALVTLKSFSDDHRKFVLRVDSPAEGPAYALVDLNTGKGVWLGDEYRDLQAKDIGDKQAIAFKAKDGLALTGYLTLPPGRPAKGLPLVVFPHGGPAARDEPGFDWWAQAMASRGYAVLQVNYRGSSGFSWEFMAAGFGQWGRKMQTDLSDGVRYLAGQGTIDPARVCIVGASYGGYAALAGATLDPGVYRCAASVSGPSDLRRMIDLDKSNDGDQGVGVERY